MADKDDDMPETAKQEIADAIRIFREDHIHARFDELRDHLTGKSNDPSSDNDTDTDDPNKPPPAKDKKDNSSADPPKKGLWW